MLDNISLGETSFLLKYDFYSDTNNIFIISQRNDLFENKYWHIHLVWVFSMCDCTDYCLNVSLDKEWTHAVCVMSQDLIWTSINHQGIWILAKGKLRINKEGETTIPEKRTAIEFVTSPDVFYIILKPRTPLTNLSMGSVQIDIPKQVVIITENYLITLFMLCLLCASIMYFNRWCEKMSVV